MLDEETERIAKEIVDAAYKVHKALGPGLLEIYYRLCFVYELQKRGLDVKVEQTFSIIYDSMKLEKALRIDILVNDRVIVELKAVDKVIPVHHAQVLSYMRLSAKRLGFLINFNVELIKNGIKRFVI